MTGLLNLLPSLLLAAVAPQPGCGPEIDHVLAQLNLARLAAGVPRLQSHASLCATAVERVREITIDGEFEQGVAAINRRTRSLYRKGYAAHAWTEAAIIGGGDDPVLEQFRQVRPAWHAEAIQGDYLEVGAAAGRLGHRPVWAILLALPRWTVEWRQAEPLRQTQWVENEILEAVNRHRATQGNSPVVLQPQLSAAARAHAEHMLRLAYYDHNSPEGTGPGDRAASTGYARRRSITENIAKGPFTPSEVVDRWMNSSGHRKNILRPASTEMGVGVAFGENENGFEVIWVQMFGGGPTDNPRDRTRNQRGGSQQVTMVPPSSLAWRLIFPPWASRISRHRGRPSPVPVLLVE